MKKIFLFLAMCVTLICGVVGLAACADSAEYSVVCETCENGYVIVADTKVKAGEKVILAAHPKGGYQLTSFLLDGEVLDGVSFIMPEKDVTVSARFEIITYSITYVLGDATVSGNNPESYTVESPAELIAPEKEGYEICAWYTFRAEPEYGYDWDIEDYRVTSIEGLFGNLTLYAEYYNPWHQIIISDDSEDGWCFVGDSTGEAQYGDTIEVTVVPDTGYEFDYLTVNGERIEETSFTMLAGDAEIAAYFKIITYAITYELDGGVNSSNNPESYTVEDGYISFEAATKEGYIFWGWYFDEAHTQYVYDIYAYDYLDSPLTLYAYFVPEDEEWWEEV